MILFAFVFLSVPSCEIGLGESVDTENPKVEITNPESNVIIRDKFVMNGTWSDDGIVKEIAITLVNTDTGKVYNFSTPTINDGTWSFTVDPFAEGIKDGPYSLSVLAKDAYAHETFASAAFSIDNTPPLVVLQRPSTVFGGTKFDSYGQEFTLKGQAADDSNVDSVIVEIFDAANFSDESVPLTTVTIPNVPPTIDLTVAKFGDAAYTKIYGDKKDEGTKRFVCKITAFDSARKVPAVEGDKGNSITYFYLYNDVYSELLKEFKVTELYKILSDNYTGTNVDGAKAALEKLQNAQYTGFSRIVKSSFSLNPLNNPTYDVSGYADLYSNGYNLENKDEVKLLNNSKLVLNFKAGLDEATILSDTIGVSLVLCDKNGNPLTGADAHEWELIKPYKDSNGNELFSQTDPYYAKRDARISTVGTGCSIIVEVGTKASADKFEPSDLILGGYYRFKITGSDANGNRILATLEDINSDYAFLLNSSGSVPTLIATASKVDSTGETAVQNTFDITSAQSVKLSGSSTIEEGEVEINVTLTKSDGTEIPYTKTTTPAITITEDTSGVNKKYLFTITIPNSEFGEGQNTVTVSTNKKNEVQVVDKAFTVNVDRTSPEISDITVDGMDYTDGTYLNGIITIKAVASDNEALESAWYEVYKGTDTIYTEKTSITPAALRSTGFKINTRDYYLKSGSVYDEGDITVKIYAKDKAGNETTGAKIGTITLAIDQSTDIPKMDFETSVLDNVNCAETDISLTANRNFFKTSDNLELTISDDDGIKSVTMVYKYTESGTQKQKNVSLPAFKVGQKEYTISKKVTDLGFVEGYGKVQIEVTDNADTTWEGTKQTWDESKKTSNEINIFVYESPITISAYNGTKKITDANSVRDVNDDFEVIIKVTEKDGHLDSITWTDDAGGSGEITTVNKTTDAEQSFTETIPKPANSTKVKRTYTATNKFGISETVSFTYNFDLDDPTLKNPTATYWTYDDSKSAKQNVKQSCDSEFYYDATKTLTVYVEAEDKGKTSPDTEEFQTDVASVEYAIVKGKQSAWVDTWTTASEIKQDWVPATPKTNAPYEIQIPADVFSETDEGQYTVFMRAIDNVGNKSAYKYANIIADKKHPEIETTTSIADNNKDDVTISGKVSEKYLQDFTVTVEKKNGAGWDKVTKSDTTYIETVPTAGTYTSAQDWSVTVKKAASQANDGVYKVTVTAKDNVGKQTPWTSKEFRIDTKEPELNTADNNFKIGNTNHAGIETKWYNATSLRLEGFYEDAGSGISEVKYTLTPAGATSANPEETITATEGAAGKYNFNATISGFTNSTTSPVADNTLTLQTTDLAGNKSGVSTYTIKVDTNPPTITTTSTVTVDSVDETLTQGNSKLVNGKKDITIKITVTDGESGIATTENGGSKVSTGVKLAIGNKTFDKQATQVSTSDEYTYTIPANTFTTAGMKTVYAKATDAAGNESEEMLFSFMVDTKGPTLSFTSHGDGVPVNKEITISGMASDDQQLAQVKLSVSVDGGSNYTELGDSTATSPTLTLSNSAWSYTLDTDDAAYNGKTITLKVTGVDAAGNENSETLTLNVDQNTDRPEIKVTNLTGTNSSDPTYYLKYGDNASVSGSVSDDDAESSAQVKVFIAASSAITTASSASKSTPTGSHIAKFLKTTDSGTIVDNVTITVPTGAVVYTYEHTVSPTITTGGTTAYDVTVFTPSSGEWTFYPYNIDDGTKEIYFFVTDNKDTSFYTGYSTGTTPELSRPYFQYKTSEKADNNNKITYVSDGTSPAIGVAQIYGNADKKDPTDPSDPSKKVEIPFVGISTDVIMGGTRYTQVKFKVTATDNNGIASMTLELKGKNTTASNTKLTTGTNGSFTATTNSDTATWETGYIDLTSATTDDFEVKVDVYDQCGLKGNGQYQFKFDKDSPTISAISIDPNLGADDVITGSAAISGASSDTGGASVESIKYMIPTTTQKAITDDATLAEEKTWISSKKDSGATNLAWKFILDEKNNDTKLARYEGQKNPSTGKTEYNYATPDNGVYTLPVYFMVTDTVGNITIDKTTSIKYDPDGDKPKITVLNPKETTLSGTIRPSGTVTIPGKTMGGGKAGGSVAGVYIQITDAEPCTTCEGVGKVNGTEETCTTCEGNRYTSWNDFDEDAKTKAGNAITSGGYGYTVVDKTGAKPEKATEWICDDSDWWGIKVDLEGDNWSTALNRLGELNLRNKDAIHYIKIRICGVNSNGKVGSWSKAKEINVAKSIPYAENVTLQQYSSALTSSTAGSAAPIIQKAHETTTRTYLKGNNWYLAMDLKDTSGIDAVSATYTVGTGNPNTATLYTSPITGTDNKKVWIAIPSGNDGKLTFTVTAKNKSSTQSEVDLTWNVYIDNKAPNLTSLTTSISGNTQFSSSVKIHDSNGSITFKGTVDEGDYTDTASGFERSVFYFMRDGKIIDPFDLYPSDYGDGINDDDVAKRKTPKKAKVTATAIEVEQDSSHKYNLYGAVYTVEKDTTTTSSTTTDNRGKLAALNQYTASGISENTNIRVGGIVRIEGLFRTITKKEGNTVTFTPAVIGHTIGDGDNAKADAEFVYGQVVDNIKNETNDGVNGYGFTVGNDDGDGMFEFIGTDAGNANWQATIRSTNMADGPVNLVVVTFDKAGNVSSHTVTGSYINNNPPRLAKVFLGTDLNGNGSFSENEFVEYKFYASTTEEAVPGVGKKEVTTGGFKIKDKLAIVPEIVGGNGDIKMVFNQAATSLNDAETTGTGALRATSSTSMTLPAGYKKAINEVPGAVKNLPDSYKAADSDFWKFEIPSSDITCGEGENKKMSFTFWDSTEDTIQGTTSQAAVLYVPDFEVDLVDDVRPNVVINKFFWKSKTENSLYGNSTANGHIELEDDIDSTFSGTKADGSTKFGSDPKVSGKIVVRGTAYDDRCLKNISVSFGDTTNATLKTAQTAATYDNNDGWGLTKVNVNGSDKDRTLENSGWTFAVYDADYVNDKDNKEKVAAFGIDWDDRDTLAYFGQEGHKVAWELTLDTEKLLGSGVYAALDQTVTVVATDSTPNSSSGRKIIEDARDGTMHRPEYKMDVVPYVTKVITNLTTSIKNATDPSIYNRTAKGHYPVNGESGKDSITLVGFNLGSETTINPATLTPGAYTHTVNGVGAINNINNNNAKGQAPSTITIADTDVDYEKLNTYAYNRKPNNKNNNTLTDDVVFDVWEFNSEAAQTFEGSTALREPVVKLNPSNGVLGFMFGSGSSRFSMPNKAGGTNGSTYQIYQYNYATYVNMALCYDELGVAHGISTGIDTYVDTNEDGTGGGQKAGRMSYFNSVWGPSRTDDVGGNFNGYNAIRFDCIGIPRNTTAETTGFGISTGREPILEEYRFYSPSIVATRKSGNGVYQRKDSENYDCATVYLAYYDKLAQQIRFRAGDVTKDHVGGGSDGTSSGTGATEGTVFGQFYHNSNSEPAFLDDHFSVIAGTGSKQSTYAGGKYLCIDVIPGNSHDEDVIVAVWQDSSTDSLIFAYNDKPYAKVDTTWKDDNTTDYGWKGLQQITYDSGYYCQIKADANGNVHIACVNGSDEVCYTYLPKDGGYANPVTVVVDSQENGVKKVSLDVETDGSKVTPYITYFATRGRPKMAYIDGGLPETITEETIKGSDTLGFTGIWETGFLPTTSKIADDEARNNTSVCVSSVIPKKANLKFKEVGTTESAVGQTGNGTANPIVGYAVSPDGTSGRIEIAQKRGTTIDAGRGGNDGYTYRARTSAPSDATEILNAPVTTQTGWGNAQELNLKNHTFVANEILFFTINDVPSGEKGFNIIRDNNGWDAIIEWNKHSSVFNEKIVSVILTQNQANALNAAPTLYIQTDSAYTLQSIKVK